MTGIRLIIFSILFSAVGYSQTDSITLSRMNAKDLKKLGNNAVLQNDFNSSVDYYNAYLRYVPNDSKIQYRIAESYRKIRDYEKAEKFYLKSYTSNPEKNILALYYYADMCKANGKYEKAKEHYAKFAKEYKGKETLLKKQAKREIVFCDSIKTIIGQSQKFVIQHLDTSINKVHVELSPVSIDENTLLFASLRTNKKEYVTEGEDSANIPVRKFYTAKKINNNWVFEDEFMAGTYNKAGDNVGNASFTPDGNKMYYTVCKPNWKGITVCAIYMTEKVNGEWSEPLKLSKTINNPNYTNTQPAVSIDPVKGNEMIFYVSNRPKGKGGMDIWYFVYDKKKKIYKAPKNAGVKINTSKDELTPFFDNDTRSLYFSSEGLGGLGGLDIFKVTGSTKAWTNSENLGEPINSGADDIYYTISKNREEGFLVSNRKGGVSLKNSTCCDDIYSHKQTSYIHLFVAGNVKDISVNSAGALDSALVDIYLVDKKTNEQILVKTIITDKTGNYKTSLEAGNEYKVIARKPGYLNTSESTSIDTRTESMDKTFENNFELSKSSNKAITLENINYEFDRSDIMKNSTLALDTTLLKILTLNPDIIVEISSHTDDKGSEEYNQKLSQKRAESVVNYLISKGIDENRLRPKGYGESMPIAPNKNKNGTDNPEGRAKNRRTDFKIVGTITNFGEED
ncbi:MAG: ompA [Bacteroidetes bacterium]|nr:ompA [Bacteroidota bacterium]MDF2451098.1 ompA [Bacteroidota bacterium]